MMGPTIRTLRDLDLIGSVKTKPVEATAIKVQNIPKLPGEESTKAMLNRVFQEFYPIIEKRGFNVASVSEMCCCGDGLDIDTRNKNTKRRRKRRIMSSNVLGYNQTCNGSSTIHLRMRDPKDHTILFPYEDVAGTMAHELAHCVYHKHDQKFYKLMDEIQEQHATYLARGLVVDKEGFPINSHQAYTLGGGRPKSSNAQAAATRAAVDRQRRTQWMPSGPQRLGGDKSFLKFLGPGEAAGVAAETRRLEDEKWCLPCQPITIEIFDSDDEEMNVDDHARHTTRQANGHDSKKTLSAEYPVEKNKENAANALFDLRKVYSQKPLVVDLTQESHDIDALSHTEHASEIQLPLQEETGWTCSKCTYKNSSVSFLACAICNTPSVSADDSLVAAKRIASLNDQAHSRNSIQKAKALIIQDVKENEARKSEEEFGFNIYGTSR